MHAAALSAAPTARRGPARSARNPPAPAAPLARGSRSHPAFASAARRTSRFLNIISGRGRWKGRTVRRGRCAPRFEQSRKSRMNRRKLAFKLGLETIKKPRQREMTRKADLVWPLRPGLYNRSGMPDVNKIIQGDCIKTLNEGPEGWVD